MLQEYRVWNVLPRNNNPQEFIGRLHVQIFLEKWDFSAPSGAIELLLWLVL